jgi:hypothetical protein
MSYLPGFGTWDSGIVHQSSSTEQKAMLRCAEREPAKAVALSREAERGLGAPATNNETCCF